MTLNAETKEAAGKLTDEAARKLMDNVKASEKAGKPALVEIRGEASQGASKVTLELSGTFLAQLSADTRADLKISNGLASITFGSKGIGAISKEASGQAIKISVARASGTDGTSSTHDLVGSRPVYTFTITGGTTGITSFGGESVKVQIPYTRGAAENANGVVVLYLDNSGNAVPVISKYNEAAQRVDFSTSHFSAFAIGYHAAGFSDTLNHWAKDSIDFTAARGWLTGVGHTIFAPDQTVTRGMLATILGKMSGAELSMRAAFTDVAAAKYYSPYVAWAASNGIVQGTGNNTFDPDRAVTREELAVILNNYIKFSKLPAGNWSTPVTFADHGQISAWASEAVSAIQGYGLISGKTGNFFDPKGTATRAEVATVLKRMIEGSFAK